MNSATICFRRNVPLHYKTLPSQAWDQCRLPDGKLYMIPTPTPDRKVPVALIRGDLRKKYGIPPISRKFSEIKPYLKAIKENEPGMIPMYLESQYDIGQPYSYLSYADGPYCEDILYATCSGTGLVWLLDDGPKKLYSIVENPVLGWNKKAAITMKAWYDARYINKDVFANKVRSKDSFAQVSRASDSQLRRYPGADPGRRRERCDVELVPGLDGNGHYRADPFLNNGVGLAANTRNAAKALQALDLIMEDPSYNFLAYFGIEGENYVMKDGKIALPEGMSADQNTYPPDAAGFWFTNKDQFPPMADWTPAYEQHKADLVSKGYLVNTPLVGFSRHSLTTLKPKSPTVTRRWFSTFSRCRSVS